LTVVEVQ